jgi:hypothetical protein
VEGGDGTIYITSVIQGVVVPKLMKVTSDGMLRLVMDNRGTLEGPIGECQAGWPVWNPKEKALYLVGRCCLRKVVEKPDGTKWVEVVAGVPCPIPGDLFEKRRPKDGPAKEAVFVATPRIGVVCDSKGTFYWLDDPYPARALRKIENGMVSTVPLKFKGSMKKFSFVHEGGMLSLGENDDTLYIPSIWSPRALFKCDLKTGELTRICGPGTTKWTNKRGGREGDGPALTHASGAGSIRSLYDPFHNAIWLWGNDTARFRWLRLDHDGWVRTTFGWRRPGTKKKLNHLRDTNALGIPGEQFNLSSCTIMYCAGIDSKGGVYINIPGRGDGSGFWRAYNKNWKKYSKKEVKR